MVNAQSEKNAGRTIARVFWQDDSGATVRYGDLKKSANGWAIDSQDVEGFPSLNLDEQSLVQMHENAGLIIVGVHDTDDGTIGSGWVGIESGVVEEPHGDHTHWRFKQTPRVLHSHVTTDQGNPAHVYQYGQSFILANDKKNGFTIASAKSIRDAKTPQAAAKFHDGGNGHITLAVIESKVAYATWIAPAGDDCGRVDVVGLGVNEGKRYSIKCPTGMLHGATTNAGKVFFAPADGVCWVNGDTDVNDAPESVKVHHLPLGKDDNDKPLRTGAFTNLGSLVLFSAGKGNGSKLCLIDASIDIPALVELPISVSEGESLSTPVAVKARGGKRLAMICRENKEAPEKDALLVVDLDPNGDGNPEDLLIMKSIAIGRNQIAGHSGHHEIVALPSGRDVIVSNPGDGTLMVISLSDAFEPVTLPLGGNPTRMVAVGGS